MPIINVLNCFRNIKMIFYNWIIWVWSFISRCWESPFLTGVKILSCHSYGTTNINTCGIKWHYVWVFWACNLISIILPVNKKFLLQTRFFWLQCNYSVFWHTSWTGDVKIVGGCKAYCSVRIVKPMPGLISIPIKSLNT